MYLAGRDATPPLNVPDLLDGISSVLTAILWPTVVLIVVLRLWPFVVAAVETITQRLATDNFEANVAGMKIAVSKAQASLVDPESKPVADALSNSQIAVLRQVESIDPRVGIKALYDLVLGRLIELADSVSVPIYSQDPTASEVAINIALQGKIDTVLVAQVAEFDEFTSFATKVPAMSRR